MDASGTPCASCASETSGTKYWNDTSKENTTDSDSRLTASIRRLQTGVVIGTLFHILLIIGLIWLAATIFGSGPTPRMTVITIILTGILAILIFRSANEMWPIVKAAPYMTGFMPRVRDNIIEIAEWVCSDPRFTAGADHETVGRVLGNILYRRDLLRDADTIQAVAEHANSILSSMTELPGAAVLARLCGLFTGMIYQHPRYWRAIDDAYREAMRLYTTGTPLESLQVEVRLNKRLRLILTDFNEAAA